jgi:hypothetical protein
MEKEKPRYFLKNWAYSPYWDSFVGESYNNPDYKDGTVIRTSKVLSYDREKKIVETLNSVYILQGEEKYA